MGAADGLQESALWAGLAWEKCPPRSLFQIDVTAGYYSQAAGALAGLSFAALVLLLGAGEREPHAPRRNADALMALFVTLYSLITTMVVYSVLAGTKPGEGRVAAAEMVAGLTFILAISMLFHALGLLLEVRPECAAITNVARWVSAVVIPVNGLLFLVMGAQDTEFLRSRPNAQGVPTYCDGSDVVQGVGLALVGAVALCLVTVKMAKWRLRWAQEHRSSVPMVTLLWSVVALFLFGVLSMQPADFIASPGMVTMFLVVAGGLLSVIGVLIHTGGKDHPAAASSDGIGKAHEGGSGPAENDFVRVLARERGWGLILVRPRRSRVPGPGS